MKNLKLSLLSSILLLVGCGVGYILNPIAAANNGCEVKSYDCKLEESRAVQGCEIAAIQVNEALSNCEYRMRFVEENLPKLCEQYYKETR